MPATKMLKDSAGNDFYPVTHASAVVRDGSTLEQALANIPTKNSQIENDANHIYANDSVKVAPASPYINTDSIVDGAVTQDKIADGAVTQDKIAGGWKLIGETTNTSNTSNLQLYLDKIYKTGTFKVIASGQCNVEGWVDLRAYSGSAVGSANLIHTSFSQVSFSDTVVNGSGSSADTANYIAAGQGKPYMAFSIEATSSNASVNWRTWNFQFGCGTWGRFGTTREASEYNKTAFSLDSQNPMYGAHIEVWWHE